MPLTRGAPLLLALTLAAGCASGAARDADDGRLRVVTTVAPLTSIAATVGGDRVRVTGLVPEGTNSHTFEPPPSAAEVLSEADLIVVNGLKLEDPTSELAEENKRADAEIVALGDRVLPREQWIFDFSFPEKDGKPNPHLWTDPKYAVRYAEVLRDEFAAADPEGQAAYDAGLAEFTRAANALSDAMVTASKTVPRRDLLTYHDGYAYFARDYGWRILGAIQPSSFEEPSPREVAALIDQVRRLKVPAIFGSEVFPSAVLEQVGKATGARYVDTLRDDDLPGKPGDPEHSWLGLMRANFVTMVEALGGDAAALKAVPLPPTTGDARAEYPQ
ncbi:MAG TPA: metal ABC transporter substrate-binding protein [Frankiaceae bacterium]|nr:metal ABC transporter substrate-binding protein [Frankiaceae bacterium]